MPRTLSDGSILFQNGRYARDVTTGCMLKLCGLWRHNRYCNQPASTDERWCKYHRNGGKQLSRTLYYSIRHGHYRCSQKHVPEEGDLKHEFGEDVYRYDSKKWRKCCKVCWRQARPEYCSTHNPDHFTHVSRHSRIACQFFDALSLETGKNIRHLHVRPQDGLPEGREFSIPGTSYHVDGYVDETQTVYEFLGDFWHGNPDRYPTDDRNRVLDKTFGELKEHTFHRLKEIANKGYRVFYVWERDYREHIRRQEGGRLQHLLRRCSVLEDLVDPVPGTPHKRSVENIPQRFVAGEQNTCSKKKLWWNALKEPSAPISSACKRVDIQLWLEGPIRKRARLLPQ